MSDEIRVKSLQKALQILECFSSKEPELGVSQISSMLGLYKSNVHNILSTFKACGYVEQNLDNGKYRLGLKMLELTHVINSSLGLHGIVYPYMSQLSMDIGEIIYFAIPKQEHILYLEGAYPHASYTMRSMVGETAQMYCTSLGKAILAFLPQEEAQLAIQGQSMESFTSTTITTHDALLQEMQATRERGYSIDNMEHEFGIKCVGVPVFRHNGALVGAMSVSGPSLRFEDAKIEEYAAKLRDYAQQMRLHL